MAVAEPGTGEASQGAYPILAGKGFSFTVNVAPSLQTPAVAEAASIAGQSSVANLPRLRTEDDLRILRWLLM